MAYQVLARKWRPKTFADLVGQEHVVKALRNALDEGRLHHAYLLTGTRGVGKTTIARILAKSLNCENAVHGEPCGQCESCTQIDSGRYVDLLEIDAASNTGIDNIREVLENAQYAPTAGKYKVYIIDEVHMLSKSAFNAMLKTLEEPPEHVKFILATTDPHKVPITVLSRCLQFVLRNMTTQQVAEHLAHVLDRENVPYQPQALQLLGRAAAGSMRDALSLLDQAIAMGSGKVAEQDVRQMIGAVDKQYLFELLEEIINQNGEALLEKAQEMSARAIGFDSALAELAMLLQRLALIQTIPSALANDDPERETLLRLSQALSGEQIQLYYQCAIHGKQDLPLAPDEYAGFVMTLLRMLAFAPLAASGCDTQSQIEHTDLHSDHQKAEAEKKPFQLPKSEPIAAPAVEKEVVPIKQDTVERPSEETIQSAQQQADVPPWEEMPSQLSAEPPQTQTAQMQEAEALPVAKVQTAPEPEEYPHMDEEIPPPYFDEAYTYEDSHRADVMGVPQPVASAEPEEEEGDEEELQFAPLPEFKTENWHSIIERFARKLGAAQMLAQNAAWTSYAAEAGLIILSLTDEAKATANKERLDKICQTLSEAYHLGNLRLQTEPWQDDKGWETPVMRRKRIQEEGRQQAQDLLEADTTAQKILQTFEAQWLPDSLELAGHS
ncbi:DNA polymerase III subunit gamma/tau [Neisseria subflava]|uniref:DNA polymerase III subunit gamma/tau n=1 Tax=Neisseria subflava TaxID=28449 RepID=UPI0010BEE97E|nr:DNA polymerase III subunit gamma/tau [Neisseria subflava]QCL70235.1 DNA polymerase III subunit gamma/tau [Neisseria subflava]WMS18293.1 DNA polymerase III subunit gamma/tau [Neisseria subflava]